MASSSPCPILCPLGLLGSLAGWHGGPLGCTVSVMLALTVLSPSWLVVGVHRPPSQDAGGGQLGAAARSWRWLVLGDIPGACPNRPPRQARFPLRPAPPSLTRLGASPPLLLSA